MLTTTFKFTLPRGLVDLVGVVHSQGVMRLATAKDEMIVQKNPASQENEVSAAIVMLSQVITELGTLTTISSQDLENLFSLDLAYLREFYNHINQNGHAHLETQCPSCQHSFKTELALAGES